MRQVALVLVSGSFEDAVPTPILGLQSSLKRDLDQIRFWGLAGTQKVADIVFSKSPGAAPANARSESITHGGFDNDVATMTSMVRRVLDVPDAVPVVDYFEDAVPGFDRAAVGSPAAPAGTRAARPASRKARRQASDGDSPARKKGPHGLDGGRQQPEDFGDKDLAEMKQSVPPTTSTSSCSSTACGTIARAATREKEARREDSSRSSADDTGVRRCRRLFPGRSTATLPSAAGRDLEPRQRHRRDGHLRACGSPRRRVVRGAGAPGDLQHNWSARALPAPARAVQRPSKATQDRAIAYDTSSFLSTTSS